MNSLGEKLKAIKQERTKEKIPVKPTQPKISGVKISSFIASIFSILFSLTIISVIEISLAYIVILFLFLSFFLIGNEYVKVKYWAKGGEEFNESKEGNKKILYFVIGIVTTLISASTSIYGIYVTVNNIDGLKEKIEQQSSQEVLTLEASIDSLDRLSTFKLDSLNKAINMELFSNYDIEKSNVAKDRYYSREARDLLFAEIQKNRDDLKQRLLTDIKSKKKQLKDLETGKEEVKETSTEKVKIVALIFIILSFIIEILIVGLSLFIGIITNKYKVNLDTYQTKIKDIEKQKEKDLEKSPEVKEYLAFKSLIITIYSLKNIGDTLSRKELKSLSNLPDLITEKFRGVIINLSIIQISGGSTKIVVEQEEAMSKLDEHYTKLAKEKDIL